MYSLFLYSLIAHCRFSSRRHHIQLVQSMTFMKYSDKTDNDFRAHVEGNNKQFYLTTQKFTNSDSITFFFSLTRWLDCLQRYWWQECLWLHQERAADCKEVLWGSVRRGLGWGACLTHWSVVPTQLSTTGDRSRLNLPSATTSTRRQVLIPALLSTTHTQAWLNTLAALLYRHPAVHTIFMRTKLHTCLSVMNSMVPLRQKVTCSPGFPSSGLICLPCRDHLQSSFHSLAHSRHTRQCLIFLH